MSTQPVVLCLVMNPKDTEHLRVDEEVKKVRLALERGHQGFNFITEGAVTDDDLRRLLLRYTPTIVHLSGHGVTDKDGGGIKFEDVRGMSHLIRADALADLFKLFHTHIRCVVLNACYSESAAAVISQHIPYVIGMSDKIGDAAALNFSVGFYDALAHGYTYEDAFKFGRNAIDLKNIPESLVPVLKQKPGGDGGPQRLFQDVVQQDRPDGAELRLALREVLRAAADLARNRVALEREPLSYKDHQMPTSRAIHFVHFSDMHCTTKPTESAEMRYCLQMMTEDLRLCCEKELKAKIDVVLFTGDLTSMGSEQEFKLVTQHLAGIRKHCRDILSDSVVFIAVPGNHDLERFDPHEHHTQDDLFDQWALENDQVSIDAFFGGTGPNSSAARKLMSRAFAEYEKWWGSVHEKTGFEKPQDLHHGILPGDFTATILKEHIAVGVMGLNSAFLHYKRRKRQEIHVHPLQFDNAAADLHAYSWLQQNHINILMTHHPPEWIGPSIGNSFKNRIAAHFDAHFCGHIHEPDSTALRLRRDSTTIARSLFSHYAYGKSERLNNYGYVIGRLAESEGQFVLSQAFRKSYGVSGEIRIDRDYDIYNAPKDQFWYDHIPLKRKPIRIAITYSIRQVGSQWEIWFSRTLRATIKLIARRQPHTRGEHLVHIMDGTQLINPKSNDYIGLDLDEHSCRDSEDSSRVLDVTFVKANR